MRIQLGLFFLTLVLRASLTLAAGQNQPEKFYPASTPEVEKPMFDTHNLSITPVEKNTAPIEKKFYYPYTKALALRTGLSIDSKRLQEDKVLGLLFGFTYMFDSSRSTHKEFGADLITQSEGHIHFSWKHLAFEKNLFRPFYKVGVLHRTNAQQEFASFVNEENYFLLVSVGFEEALELPNSLRLEIELAQGIKTTVVNLIIGSSWGF